MSGYRQHRLVKLIHVEPGFALTTNYIVRHEHCRRHPPGCPWKFHRALQDKVEQQWIVIVNLVNAKALFSIEVAVPDKRPGATIG